MVAPVMAVPPTYHWKVPVPLAVSVVLPPVQKEVAPAMIGAVGIGLIVTVVIALWGEVQPLALVTVTV